MIESMPIQIHKMHSGRRKGVWAILVASILSSLTGAAFYTAHLFDPLFSSFCGSFIRVLANLFIATALSQIQSRSTNRIPFPSRKHRELWAWGFFGALTVTSYFASVSLIGNGQSAFLGASCGVFIAALSPLMTGYRADSCQWFAIGGSLLGIYFLCAKQPLEGSCIGTSLAIMSGLFAALAYLMISRTRGAYSTATVMSVWCIVALFAHVMVFIFFNVTWPTELRAWVYLGIAGLTASFAQHFTTYAFQRSSPMLMASLSYLTPVFSLALDMIFFGFDPVWQSELGAVLVVAFGALVPLMSARKKMDSQREIQKNMESAPT